jgi:4-amino-4-deoxy-L-arabinose transferase-like glycosyltransferase
MSPGNSKMEYRVTFKSMLGLALVLSIFAVLFIGNAILYKKPLHVVPGILLFALPVVIRIRFKVIVDEKQIEYTGFFTTKVVRFSDIVHSGWMFKHGRSRDRFYGSFVYEILSKNDCIRVNFRLFPLDTMGTVIEMLENLRDKSTMADG